MIDYKEEKQDKTQEAIYVPSPRVCCGTYVCFG